MDIHDSKNDLGNSEENIEILVEEPVVAENIEGIHAGEVPKEEKDEKKEDDDLKIPYDPELAKKHTIKSFSEKTRFNPRGKETTKPTNINFRVLTKVKKDIASKKIAMELIKKNPPLKKKGGSDTVKEFRRLGSHGHSNLPIPSANKTTVFKSYDFNSNTTIDIEKFNLDMGKCNVDDDNKPYKKEDSVPDVKLSGVFINVLKDVTDGKIDTFENAIGKLRMYFEEANIFGNVKKRKLVLLNFEDDTSRPVLQIEDKYMNVIQSWYDACDIACDLEDTNIYIPESISTLDISGILFRDINYKYKDEFVYQYIPLTINNIITERILKNIENKCLVDVDKKDRSKEIYHYECPIGKDIYSVPKKPSMSNNKNKFPDIISKLGITLPENIRSLMGVGCAIKDGTTYLDIDKKDDEKPFEKLFEKSSDSIVPYNTDYDCLYPGPFDACMKIGGEPIVEKVVHRMPEKEDAIYVMINDKFFNTFTIKSPETGSDVYDVINNYPEYGFSKLFAIKTDNQDIISFIEREFDNNVFNDVDEINKKILVTSQYIDFSNKQNKSMMKASEEEQQIQEYLKMKYDITDDVNDRMKASELCDLIINSGIVKVDKNSNSFKTRLSKYLKELGLKKKRYNDGFYYYGLVERLPIVSKPKYGANVNEEFEKFKRERDDLSNLLAHENKAKMFVEHRNNELNSFFEQINHSTINKINDGNKGIDDITKKQQQLGPWNAPVKQNVSLDIRTEPSNPNMKVYPFIASEIPKPDIFVPVNDKFEKLVDHREDDFDSFYSMTPRYPIVDDISKIDMVDIPVKTIGRKWDTSWNTSEIMPDFYDENEEDDD